MLAFLLGRKISYDVLSLLLVRVLLHMMLVGLAFKLGKKISDVMFSFFCVGKFWQMMLASARIYVGQENFL